MTTIKEKLAKTKKFVSDYSDDILVAGSVVAGVFAAVLALKVAKDSRVTEGVWKAIVTDEMRELMAVEGAKFQTTVVFGQRPTWRITTPDED